MSSDQIVWGVRDNIKSQSVTNLLSSTAKKRWALIPWQFNQQWNDKWRKGRRKFSKISREIEIDSKFRYRLFASLFAHEFNYEDCYHVRQESDGIVFPLGKQLITRSECLLHRMSLYLGNEATFGKMEICIEKLENLIPEEQILLCRMPQENFSRCSLCSTREVLIEKFPKWKVNIFHLNQNWMIKTSSYFNERLLSVSVFRAKLVQLN